MSRVEDKFEAYKGKYVSVNVHLLSHLGRPKEMMYAGDCNFISSREEHLDGSASFRGLKGWPEHTFERDGLITIYNNNPPSDIPERLRLDEEQLTETERLWKARSKPTSVRD